MRTYDFLGNMALDWLNVIVSKHSPTRINIMDGLKMEVRNKFVSHALMMKNQLYSMTEFFLCCFIVLGGSRCHVRLHHSCQCQGWIHTCQQGKDGW